LGYEVVEIGMEVNSWDIGQKKRRELWKIGSQRLEFLFTFSLKLDFFG
jgi:hypothetical protein